MPTQHDAPDSDYTGPDRRRPQHRGWRFDPTVNAGHVITFLGMAAAVFIAWANLDKRVLVLEERGSYQKLRDDTQDQAVTQQLVEIKSAIGDVRRGVDDIRREQMGKGAPQPQRGTQ
jgi:hypothetical protein